MKINLHDILNRLKESRPAVREAANRCMAAIIDYFKERWPYYAVLTAGIAVTVLIFYCQGLKLLDSDMSSELVLGKLLNDEGGILSDNWCYSTELRVIGAQIAYKLFFYFSDNWHLVRTLSAAVLLFILMSSYCFFAERWNLGKTGLLCGLVLLLPFSADYVCFVIWGGYYLPHLAFLFLALGLARPFKTERSNKIAIVLSAVLAFLAGLGGIRSALIIYAPFVLTSAFFAVGYVLSERRDGVGGETKDKLLHFAKISAVAVLGNLTGICVCFGYLSHIYKINGFGRVGITDVIPSLIFDFALRSFNSVLGYTGFGISLNADVFRALFVLICLVLPALACIKFSKLEPEGKFTVAFAVIGFAFNAVVCCMSQQMQVRYLLPSLMMLFPTAAVILNYFDGQGLKLIKNIFIGLAALCLSVQTVSFAVKPYCTNSADKRASNYSFAYGDEKYNNRTVSSDYFEDAVRFLLKHKYSKGFATFWHSNILTELSDGKIEMWTVDNKGAVIGSWTRLKKYAWLQDQRHLTKEPKGKVFLFLNKKELKFDPAKLYADKKHLIFKNKEFAIYGYSSARAMYNNLCGKKLNRIMKIKTSAGKIRECGSGLISLEPGAELLGPYLHACREKYELVVDCAGNCGSSCKGLLVYGRSGRKKEFRLANGLNIIHLNIEDGESEWRLEIANRSEKSLKIKSLRLKKKRLG
ncbi:hypothetical protein IJT93_02825 [bacterium]|nr:hypothetical protein [bacterium]